MKTVFPFSPFLADVKTALGAFVESTAGSVAGSAFWVRACMWLVEAAGWFGSASRRLLVYLSLTCATLLFVALLPVFAFAAGLVSAVIVLMLAVAVVVEAARDALHARRCRRDFPELNVDEFDESWPWPDMPSELPGAMGDASAPDTMADVSMAGDFPVLTDEVRQEIETPVSEHDGWFPPRARRVPGDGKLYPGLTVGFAYGRLYLWHDATRSWAATLGQLRKLDDVGQDAAFRADLLCNLLRQQLPGLDLVPPAVDKSGPI
jgi:hypothetical protein